MTNIPTNLRYTKDHEWAKSIDDTTVEIGITDFAQDSLGDVTFVELPQVGQSFSQGDTFGVIDSVKAASDLYMPVDGEVLEINSELDAAPESINNDPYGAWIIRVRSSSTLESLLDAEAYKAATG